MGKRGPKVGHKGSQAERFNIKVKRGEGCWEWTGAKLRTGYGRITVSTGKVCSAHHLSYEFSCGPVPKGMCVLHICDNPACVRPDHLFLGTHNDNMKDMTAKERSGGRILKREDAYAILWHEVSGEPRQTLADEYGVTYQTVRNIAQRRTWPSLSISHD
jgi:hypothetical protein